MTQQNTGSQTLFRERAIRLQQQRLQGDVLVLPRVSTVVLTCGLLLSVFLLVLFLIFGQYARFETVKGWLAPSIGIAKHFAGRERSLVQHVHVREGEYVERGQTILSLVSQTTRNNGDVVEQQLLGQYAQQVKNLESQIASQKSVYEANMATQHAKLTFATESLAQIKVQQGLLLERELLLKKRLERAQKMLLQGYVAQHDVDEVQSQWLMLLDSKQSLSRQLTEQQNNTQQLQQQLAVLPQQHRNTIEQLAFQISDIEQRITRLSAEHQYSIVAAQSGIISNLQVLAGQTINPHQVVFSVVPNDSRLIANILIPVRAIGFVQKEQTIDIRYDAFPFQKFGIHDGVLTAVSSSVVLPNELNNAPIAIQEPMYLIRADLNQQYVEAFGDDVPLKAGMTFNADIELDERSLLEWLFEPLISLAGRF